MSAKVAFEDWLANCTPNQYKDTTIKSYIDALNKAPVQLGIDIPPIVTCTDSKDFEKIYSQLLGSKDYELVNTRFNGELSAALNAYRMYIAFWEKVLPIGGDNEVYSAAWFNTVAQSDEMKTFDKEIQTRREEFCAKFGISQLEALTGRKLLTTLFLNDEENKDNLCYMLEFSPKMRGFGGIGGGSAYKYGLFYHKKNHCWITGSPSRPQKLSEEEAIKVAAGIRDNLVTGAKIISAHTDFDSVEGYEKLYDKLQNIPSIDSVWVLKYYQMLFPDILPVFYGKDIQTEVIHFLKQEPSEIPFVRMGQIALFVRQCAISSVVFGCILFDTYKVANDTNSKSDGEGAVDALADEKTDSVRYWLYTPGEGSLMWEEFYKKGIMAIGWEFIGDLRNFKSKDAMKQRMKELDEPSLSYLHAAHATWQFANDIKIGDIIFAKKGRSSIIGRGVVTSDYEYDESAKEYNNIRHVNWTHNGEWPYPGQASVKTLTEITPYTDCVDKLCLMFASDDDADEEEHAVDYPAYSEHDFLTDVYMAASDYQTLVNLIRSKRNIILQGAPGVGKTFAAKRLAYSMMGMKDQNRVMMIQFHQSYSYEDFIMGFRPSANGFELKKGAFYNFCKKAEIDSDNEYFFIIDEINRGNLSKIFGELFMLIESDKRGIQLQLLYSDERFAVPKNVYIIGMMNTADRSLAMLDYALRRRFAFYEMRPGFDTDGFREYRMKLGSDKFDSLIHCIESLNNTIAADESLGEGFCVGHSYFCNLTTDSVTDMALSAIVEYEMIPLLKEYWFDEPTKVKDWTSKLRSAVK